MTDLFDKRSEKDKLLDWMKGYDWIRTSDVLKWGAQNYSNRALRNAQQLCTEGKIRRATDEEKIRLVGISKEGIWIPI